MYLELTNEEKNEYVRNMCSIVGNTPIKGKLTTNGKQIELTNNQLINTGIISRGFKYEVLHAKELHILRLLKLRNK